MKTTPVPTSLNPCRCDHCTEPVLDADGHPVRAEDGTPQRIPRSGIFHWFCDVCEQGPFDRRRNRPYFVPLFKNEQNEVVGRRCACSKACALELEDRRKIEARQAARVRGDTETVKRITMELEEAKAARESPASPRVEDHG